MVTYSIKLNDHESVSVKRRKNELSCHCYIKKDRKNYDLGSDWIVAIQKNVKRRLEQPLANGGKKTFLMLSEPHNAMFLQKQDGKVTLSCHTFDGSIIKTIDVTTTKLELTKDNATTDDIDKLLGFSSYSKTVSLGVL